MKKNKIIILYSGEYPGRTASCRRVELYKKGLVDSGAFVDVVSTYNLCGNKFFYIYYSIAVYFIIINKILSLDNDVNVVIVYGYGWLGIWLVGILLKFKNIKFVLEINEKPYSTYGNRITEIKFVKSFNRFVFEKFVLHKIDGFVVISENLKDYCIKHKSKSAKILKVPILVDLLMNKFKDVVIDLHKPFLLHAGALSDRKDGITCVFEAFALANKKLENKLHFYLTDKMAPEETLLQINRIISQSNLNSNVHFLGSISEELLSTYRANCSMLILNKPDNEQNRFNFPTKLGEFLVVNKPVIYTPVGEMCIYLKNVLNSYEVPFNNPKMLSEKIVDIVSNSIAIKKEGLSGIELAKQEFAYNNHGKRMFEFLNNI